MYEEAAKVRRRRSVDIKNNRINLNNCIKVTDVEQLRNYLMVGDFIMFCNLTSYYGYTAVRTVASSPGGDRHGTKELILGKITAVYPFLVELDGNKCYRWVDVMIGDPILWREEEQKFEYLCKRDIKFEIDNAFIVNRLEEFKKVRERTDFLMSDEQIRIFQAECGKYLNK